MIRSCLLVLALAGLLAAADAEADGAQIHVVHDFEGAFHPVEPPPDAATRLAGVFPAGWREDSTWRGADCDIRYQRLAENPWSGAASWRISVSAVRAGRAQMNIDGVPLDPERFIRITLAARSTTSSRVQLALSMSHSPWRHHWSESLVPRPEWAVYRFLVPPVGSDPTSRFMLIFDHAGQIDIDDVEIAYLDPAALPQDRDLSGNLLASSCFPDGWAGGWVPQPDDWLDEHYRSDGAMPGPSGIPSLRITPPLNGRPDAHLSTAFWGRGGEIHTVSCWARGSRSGQRIFLRCGPPEAALWNEPWQQILDLEPQWQRFRFSLRLPYTADGFYLLRVTSHSEGEFWLDGMQVEVGATDGSYVRSGPGQVELVLSPQRNAGIHFAGDQLGLRWSAHGAIAAGARLEGRVIDIRDRSRDLPVQPLQPDAGTLLRGELAIDTTGLAGLGSYLVQLQVLDAAGAPLSRTSELLLTRVRQPRDHGERLPDSPFGIHIRYDQRMARMARDLGFTWVRTLYHSNWNEVQPTPDSWQWERLDRRLQLLEDHDLMVLGVLAGAPHWANAAPADFRGWNAMNFRIEDLDAWREFCRRAAARYAGRVDHWEIWNEPFLTNFLPSAVDERGQLVHASPEDFLPMLAAGAAGVAAGNPQAKRLWNSGAFGYDEAWDRRLIELGAYEHCDIVSYHHYFGGRAGFPGDQLQLAIARIAEHRPADVAARPVWNSEGGPGGTLQGPYRERPPGDLRMEAHGWADQLIRAYVSILAGGAERYFLYSFYGHGHWKPSYDNLSQDGMPSFNAVALSNLAWHIEGRSFRRCVALGAGIHAFCFSADSGSVAILLSSGMQRPQLPALPSGWTLRDPYGNPLAAPLAVGAEALFIDAPGTAIDALVDALPRF